MPKQNTALRSNFEDDCISGPTASLGEIDPAILVEIAITGTQQQIKLGKKRLSTVEKTDICPPIHNIVVVTSPIGDQTPPALAAITVIPTNRSRSSLS
jgi:hypothetical protein